MKKKRTVLPLGLPAQEEADRVRPRSQLPPDKAPKRTDRGRKAGSKKYAGDGRTAAVTGVYYILRTVPSVTPFSLKASMAYQ